MTRRPTVLTHDTRRASLLTAVQMRVTAERQYPDTMSKSYLNYFRHSKSFRKLSIDINNAIIYSLSIIL